MKRFQTKDTEIRTKVCELIKDLRKLEMPFLTIRQKNLSTMGSASMFCNSITQMKGWN